MTKLIAIHANPGQPEDFNSLSKYLDSQKYELMPINAHLDRWISIIEQSESPVVILAHSWGAYRFFQELPHLESKIAQIFLISPWLKVEKPVPSFMRKLMLVPILGHLLIKRTYRGSLKPFLKEFFHPTVGGAHPALKKTEEKLQSHWSSWYQVYRLTLLMQERPLQSIQTKVPITVIVGTRDAFVDANIQLSLLNNTSQLKVRTLEGAGHCLLVTHAEQLAHLLHDERWQVVHA